MMEYEAAYQRLQKEYRELDERCEKAEEALKIKEKENTELLEIAKELYNTMGYRLDNHVCSMARKRYRNYVSQKEGDKNEV